MELVAGLPRQFLVVCDGERVPPFRQCIEWFVLRLCYDSHLITPHRIYQPAALDNCLRTNEDEINFIHNISDGGIKHYSARDADRSQGLVGLEAVETR